MEEMLPDLREGLRGLCRRHGWSYGVFWGFDRRNPRLLVMEESFYEESVEAGISNAATQVHLVGEGTIGRAALGGEHQWIYTNNCCDESSLTCLARNAEIFKGTDEWQDQFLAAIKTIVIIPLPSLGVVQFGSSEKNVENLEFIYQVQQLFHQLHNTTIDICDQSKALASMASSYKSLDSLHDVISKELQADVQFPSTTTLLPTLFALGSHGESRSLSGSINPRSSTIPPIIAPMGTFHSSGNPFITSQYGASSSDSRLLLPENNHFSYGSHNSLAANFNANNWAEQQIFHGMATSSHSTVQQMNPLHLFYGDSVSTCSPCGLQDMVYDSEKVLDLQHSSSSSSSPFKIDGLSASVASSKSASFASDLPDNFLAIPPELSPEPSALPKIRDDLPNLANESLNEPTEDKLVNVQSEPISCSSPSNSLLAVPAGSSVVKAQNSLDTDGGKKECSKCLPTQPLSDNDLFEGMGLDLNPKELTKECWDDFIIPLGNGSSSNGISELDMCSIAVADKGLFTESSFEQLLETVVSGSANLSSSQSSTPTNVISTSRLDLDHRLSALARGDYLRVCKDEALLRELNLDKIMRRPTEEVFSFAEKKAYSSKSHVSSWIEDSCSMNAESAITNQPKKPAETAKVARKRARPGESTRPRPKDRQQIQDGVKELREIVPNSSKCSIDSLLDRTIKHMLFLQSVTKYADKLKHTDEPKMIGNESGVVLKDNSGSGSSGATWAYEVAGQTMVCPILVEDLNPPGFMLVEMLCEDRGFFLEIADIIHGFGLTILKGVMEIRENKVWARFLVEAHKDVTRMDIFLSLVQLSQQTSSIRSREPHTKVNDRGVSVPLTNYQQSPVSIPICRS